MFTSTYVIAVTQNTLLLAVKTLATEANRARMTHWK